MNPCTDDILVHYGVKRRSGRYPWGSGDNPYQRSGDFLSRVEQLKKAGWKDTPENVEKEFGLTTTEFRMAVRRAGIDRRNLQVDRARSLKKDGLNNSEIALAMFGTKSKESTVRSLLNDAVNDRKNAALETAQILKKELDEKGMIDVGKGAELAAELGVSRDTFKQALYTLEAEYGVNRFGIGVKNVTNPGKQTTIELITNSPEKDESYAYKHLDEIRPLGDFHSTDGGFTYSKREPPASISSDRVMIRFREDGGLAKDGVIELRRGVPDLDLQSSHYAQVRILVDGNKYLKGMAIYSDNMPDGVDVVVNSNKSRSVGKNGAMKPVSKADPDNPFGAYIKAGGQYHYTDKDGVERLGAINKLKEEGDWDTQARTVSSQFLSKQPVQIVKRQLELTYSDYVSELEDIMSLTNPTVKRKCLEDFAGRCDSAVVHLKASKFPGQRTRVILPITEMRESEVYAPDLPNGTQVVLVRYPHGGIFEIPTLTVNNRVPAARRTLGEITDAIGINEKVAERLSGADFDGDTVTLIPVNERVRFRTKPALQDLKDFDPKTEYSIPPGNPNKVKIMTKENTQNQMGIVSNLITDMTLKGATDSEIARAVKHSMVVIDAAKHELNYTQSEKDNGIAELKSKYQTGGASTLLSRRKQEIDVPERRGSGRIDPETGRMVYKETGGTHWDPKSGEYVPNTQKAHLLNEVNDLRILSSGTEAEEAYAAYGNKMAALANRVRLEYLTTPRQKYDAQAKKDYADEVESLNAKLRVAQANAPRERQAQIIANTKIKALLEANPEIAKDKKQYRKTAQLAIEEARHQVGASGKNRRIQLTDREWEAIQAGAVSDSRAAEIFRFCEDGAVQQRAMPRQSSELSTAKQARLNAMRASGFTIAEIAEVMGVSAATVTKYVRE